MSQIEFQNIPLKSIFPDPNQPRKFYDETAMDELTNSIKESGVLQPILVREQPERHDMYLIVCGERRYRASKTAGLKEIPAIIRSITDEEALQLQIVENLQRKDVHPMEEAVAFKSLHEKMAIEEIANRVGKSEKYVARRIKLTDLIEEFQTILYGNHMDLTEASMLAKLDHDQQTEILKELAPKDWKKKQGEWRMGNITRYCNKASNELSGSGFKLTDAKIYPEAGACSTCKFNSANQPLLFDDKKAICSKPSCFAIKQNRSRVAKFEKVAADPNVVCVILDSYLTDDDERMQKQAAIDAGIKILDHKLFERAYEEEPPQTWEEWLEDEKWNYEDGDEDEGDYSFDEAEARKDYEHYKVAQQEDYEAFQKAKEQGQFIEAYVVAGSKAGKTVSIKLKNEAAKKQADAIASGDDNDAILAEIASIESREIRNTELDAEKVYAKVQEFFMKSDVIQGSGRSDMKLTQNEIIGIVLSLREAGGYQYKKWLEDTYGLSDDYHLQPDSLKSIEGLTELGLNDCLLMFMKEKLPMNLGNPNISHLKKAEAKAVYNITMDYHSTEVRKAEVEQGEVAENRIQRVEKRIAALKKKIK